MGRHEEAVADLTRAIGLNLGYAWAFGSRGQCYQALARYEEAVADLTRAIEPGPGVCLGLRRARRDVPADGQA